MTTFEIEYGTTKEFFNGEFMKKREGWKRAIRESWIEHTTIYSKRNAFTIAIILIDSSIRNKKRRYPKNGE